MNLEIDNRSQTSSQSRQEPKRWHFLARMLCPCLLPRKTSIIKRTINLDTSSADSQMDKETAQRDGELDLSGGTHLKKNSSRQRKISEEENPRREALLHRVSSVYPEKSMRQTMRIQLTYNNRMRSMEEMNWPVCNLTENQMISIGDDKGQLLVKVAPVTIATDPDKFKKQMSKAGMRKEKIKAVLKFDNYEFDKFWNERYLFFERFDEGIKIKEDSWSRMPYESLAEYISTKCKGAKVILDGYAGVGSLTIKLASINTCAKVIANEKDKEKLSFLLNNATIYEVDSFLELSNMDFLQLEKKKVDVVILQPPMDEIQNQVRALDGIVAKAMTLAPNLILLLPHDNNIEALVASICRWAKKLSWMRQFCTITIQKIYNKQQLKYILVCAGKLVQTEIKLSDELDYIYSRLRKYGDKYFKHKKIIKKIREEHGMLELLNLVKQSEKIKKQTFIKNPVSNHEMFTIDFFYELIVTKKLVTADRLAKIMQEQEETLQRAESILYSGAMEEPSIQPASPIMEEEKLQENPLTLRQPELTTSQYSYLSYLESIGKKSREPSLKSSVEKGVETGSGVIIKRSEPQGSKLGLDSIDGSSDTGGNQEEKGQASNIVSVGTKSRNSDVQQLKKEEHEHYRKKTTFKQ